MEGETLQPWVTIRASGDVKVIQSEPMWLDVSGYRDVVAWLDVREVTHPGGAVKVRCTYQTAPERDDALFVTIGDRIELGSGTVTVTQMLGSLSAPPLGKYFRWMLDLTASSSATWKATFRILVALNRPGYRTPAYLTKAEPRSIIAESTMLAPKKEEGDSTSMPIWNIKK